MPARPARRCRSRWTCACGSTSCRKRRCAIVYDTGVRVELDDAAGATNAGSAVALVECFTGRRPLADLDPNLPEDFTAHLTRAAQVL